MELLDLGNVLSAIASFNEQFYSPPMLIIMHALVFFVPLAMYFGRGRKWVDSLTKCWLGASFFILAFFLFTMYRWFLDEVGTSFLIFPAFTLIYIGIGIYILLDIRRNKYHFASSDSDKATRLVGLLTALGGYALYIIIQIIDGHGFTGIVLYGAELPLLSYVIGLLIMAIPYTPTVLLVSISVWAGFGGLLAGIVFPYVADYLATGAGIVGIIMFFKWRKNMKMIAATT
jgi:hypothetical protein